MVVSKNVFFISVSVFLIFHFLCFGQRSVNQKDEFFSEAFSFPSNRQDGLTLKGTLTIPIKFNRTDKLVILVSPPLAISRDYSGIFSGLASELGRQGIAVLRYDNRSYVDSSWANGEKATMINQADDVSAALLALRKDKRFSDSRIGLLGHSEGGAAAAIAASKDKSVSFIVLLSTMGINGLELTHSQMTAKIKDSFRSMTDTQLISTSRDIYKYLEIVANNETVDLIGQKIDDYTRSQLKSNPEKFGTISIDETVKSFQNLLLKPRLIAYVQFRPEKYYSNIDCPAFFVWGSDDTQIDCNLNMKGIKKIFDETGQGNYRLETIEGMDHSLRGSKSLNSNAVNRFDDLIFKKLCSMVANWVKDV